MPWLRMLLASALATCVLLVSNADAELAIDPDRAFELTADSLEYRGKTDLYIAQGNVRIVQEGRRIQADWVAFNNETRRGIATGNVEVRDENELIQAHLVEFDVDTLEGILFEGLFDTGEYGFRVWADELERTGEDRYALRRGVFTTCRCPEGERDPWTVTSRKADVHVGGYGLTRNTSFDVLGVPVAWFPWLLFPVKTERETGLLFPHLGYSGSNGFEIGVPFFWAAREDLNVILTPGYMSERGFKPGAELEWVYGSDSSLEVAGSYVHDQGVVTDKDRTAYAKTPFSRNRWFAEGRLEQELPGKWRIRANIDQISDNNYVIDFNELEEYRTYRNLESTVFGFGSFGGDGSVAGFASVMTADDLQNPDDQDRDDYILQRLPYVEMNLLPAGQSLLGGVVAALDTEYIYFGAWNSVKSSIGDRLDVNGTFADVGIDALPNEFENRNDKGNVLVDFYQDDFVTDGGPEGDGIYQEGEPLLDRGHRLDLHPRLAYPFRAFGGVEVYPEVGYRETLYFTDEHGSEERGAFTGRVDLRTRLRGRFDAPWLPPAHHVVEPRIGYAFLEHRSQRGNPLFVPNALVDGHISRQLTLDNIVRDPTDRLENTNLLRLGVVNRFYKELAGGATGPLRSEFEISLGWDFHDQDFGLLLVDGSTFPIQGVRTVFNLGFDPDQDNIEQGLFDLTFALPKLGIVGGRFGARYRYRRDVPRFFEDFQDGERYKDFKDLEKVDQVEGRLRLDLAERWSLSVRAEYSFDEDIVLRSGAGIEYVSKCRCWAVGLEYSDSRNRDGEFMIKYNLLGLGDDASNPFEDGFGLGSGDVDR